MKDKIMKFHLEVIKLCKYIDISIPKYHNYVTSCGHFKKK